MNQNTKTKIEKYCEENDINVINIRNVKRNSKTRIVITCLCKECRERYDIRWETLQRQKYAGLCTSCAHRECAKHKLLQVEEIIERFNKEGYQVITPKDKIKRRGKRSIYFTNVEIQNKYGDVYTTNCNNFCQNISYYRELSNCDKRNEMLKNESRLEYKVRKFLEENNIPYKQEFRFMDCRGKKYPLPFDFCLYYESDSKLLIEVDGAQHFRQDSLWADRFKATQKNDKIKNYYCAHNHIPLLRLRTEDIDNKDKLYQEKILEFIKNNK